MLNSKYRSLSERVLGITMHQVDQQQERHLDFTYINRVIVWNALGNSLSYVLPFMDVSKVKGLFNSSSKLTEYTTLDEGEMSSDSLCPSCSSTQICMPFTAKPCLHVYCYYCVALLLNNKHNCLKCGERIREIERLQ